MENTLTIYALIYLASQLYLFYLVYKIGTYFLKAVCSEENRTYTGYFNEIMKIPFHQIAFMLPFPYINEIYQEDASKHLLQKRRRYVILFYIVFIVSTLISLV